MRILSTQLVFGITFRILILGFFFNSSIYTKAENFQENALAAVIIGEAGNQGEIGLEAVWEVIWTRHIERGRSVFDIITEPFQFACLNSISLNQLIKKNKKSKRWKFCLNLVKNPPKTKYAKGANHFYSLLQKPPYWAYIGRETAKIKNHVFIHL